MTKEAAQRSAMRRMALMKAAAPYSGYSGGLGPVMEGIAAGQMPPQVRPTMGAPSYAHPNDPSRQPPTAKGVFGRLAGIGARGFPGGLRSLPQVAAAGRAVGRAVAPYVEGFPGAGQAIRAGRAAGRWLNGLSRPTQPTPPPQKPAFRPAFNLNTVNQ